MVRDYLINFECESITEFYVKHFLAGREFISFISYCVGFFLLLMLEKVLIINF